MISTSLSSEAGPAIVEICADLDSALSGGFISVLSSSSMSSSREIASIIDCPALLEPAPLRVGVIKLAGVLEAGLLRDEEEETGFWIPLRPIRGVRGAGEAILPVVDFRAFATGRSVIPRSMASCRSWSANEWTFRKRF